MLRNILAWGAVTLIAGAITVAIGQFRMKGWGKFSYWWNGEGVPIFLILWFIIGGIFMAGGCLRDTAP